ncbi:hypothetical protein BTW10_18185, partial [Chromohalobacter japonicus]
MPQQVSDEFKTLAAWKQLMLGAADLSPLLTQLLSMARTIARIWLLVTLKLAAYRRGRTLHDG